MNKKKLFTLAGILTTVIALGGSAIACHFHKESTTDEIKTEMTRVENPQNDTNSQSKEDVIRKTPEPPLLKYAVPPLREDIREPGVIIHPPIMSLYAVPNFESDDNTNNSDKLPQRENPWK